MKTLFKISMVFAFIFLGGIAGCQVRVFSDRIVWKRLDYFPYPVEKLLVLKPFGDEFWVETTDNEIYKVTYPCEKGQTCWEKSSEVPPSPPDGEYGEYNVSEGKCDTFSDVSSLRDGVKMCITSVELGGESLYVVLLALTDKHELWIWDSPWGSPYTAMGNMFLAICPGSLIGLIVGVLLIQIQVPAKKRKGE